MRIFVLILLLFLGLDVISQSPNSLLRRGNKEFREGNAREAEMHYREVLEQDSRNLKALYNLSNALYRQGRYEEAAEILDGLSHMADSPDQRADILHNLGNARIGEQKVQEGIDAYKDALRIRPQDSDTRHNLAYALQLLQEQEQQQQSQDQDDEQDEDNEQDSSQQQQPDDGSQEEQQPQPRPDEISPQDAERILDALNQQEQKVQENIDREERQRVPRRVQREW